MAFYVKSETELIRRLTRPKPDRGASSRAPGDLGTGRSASYVAYLLAGTPALGMADRRHPDDHRW